MFVTVDSSDTDTIEGVAQGTGIALNTNFGVWEFTYVHSSACWRFSTRPPDEAREYAHIQYAAEKALPGTTSAVNWSLDTEQATSVVLTKNVTLSLVGSPRAGATYVMRIVQDTTGGHTVTWPGVVRWPGGVAATLSTAANAVDIVTMTSDGTNLFAVASLNFS